MKKNKTSFIHSNWAKTHTLSLVSIFLLVSCGGGGTPTPTVTLSALSSSVLLENATTLTWSSTNATSCSASGAWTGVKSLAGSEIVTVSTVGNNSFVLTCINGSKFGSSSVIIEGYRNIDGIVADGYVSGAEVFIDRNNNFTIDYDEDQTMSNSDGQFTLKHRNGNLISIGGMDLDSQILLNNFLMLQKMTGYSEFKAVTPVTSAAAFMNSPDEIYGALGIDSSININEFDPVANKGDGGINDYVYEKGNQLTVLAYALQNIANNINISTDSTKDFFQSISAVLDAEYSDSQAIVDIETAAFSGKVLDSIIISKDLIIADDLRADVLSALAAVLPVLEVKASKDLTTSVTRFALSAFQEDIQAIANGTFEPDSLKNYKEDILNYIATDQGIDANKIAPKINAAVDTSTTLEDTSVDISVLPNDSYLTSAPISISLQNPANGQVAFKSSGITIGGELSIISYTPNLNFNGTDSFTYTLAQGDKTSSAEVQITIEPVNDAPYIDTGTPISTPENQKAVATIRLADVDEGDQLTLSLNGGDDASSFNLSTDNILTFKEAPDFETKNLYSLALLVTDGLLATSKDMRIKVTNVNDIAPEFTSNTNFNASENQTSVGSSTATDGEGDAVTFTISGDALDISPAGEITFAAAPDFESNASYSATVTAFDGVNSTTQVVTVSVLDVNEAPVITSSSTLSAAENQTALGSVSVLDPESDPLTYTLSGADAGSLAVSSEGLLSFNAAPNFEIKAAYTATVSVNDGTFTTPQDIEISITDQNDAPVATAVSHQFDLLPQSQSSTTIALAASDEDGDALTYSIVSNGSYGTATVSGSSAAYQTDASTQSNHTESFTFQVSDGDLSSSPAAATVAINSDPLYQHQWHLNNTAQSNFSNQGGVGVAGNDLNVDSIIVSGVYGAGIKIAVVDEGLDINHEDLAPNVIANKSWDFIQEDNDPTVPSTTDNGEDHGTSVAGIIASAGWNNVGGRGVAPNATIVGYNYLLSSQSATVKAMILGDGNLGGNNLAADIDIFNNSWGYTHSGPDAVRYLLGGLMPSTELNAYINGVTNGRDGKGVIYVKSAGNDWYYFDPDFEGGKYIYCGETAMPGVFSERMSCSDTSYEGAHNFPYSIIVAALHAGNYASQEKSTYSTPGASMWVSAFGGEGGYWHPTITTTDNSSCSKGYVRSDSNPDYAPTLNNQGNHPDNPNCNYTASFNGTSSAAPMVAGVVALMLEKNPNLTWRDVKHILATTSVPIDLSMSKTISSITQYSWVTNAAGYKHHSWYGFGKIDAAAAVSAASSYTAGSLGTFVTTGDLSTGTIEEAIDFGTKTKTMSISSPAGSDNKIEFIRVGLKISHSKPQHLGYRLTSPDGTTVPLLTPYTAISGGRNNDLYSIGVSSLYGESIGGTWILSLDDYTDDGTNGDLTEWRMEIYGH
jgi:subtilisin family serine protease